MWQGQRPGPSAHFSPGFEQREADVIIERHPCALEEQNRARLEGAKRTTGCRRAIAGSEAPRSAFPPARARFCQSRDFRYTRLMVRNPG